MGKNNKPQEHPEVKDIKNICDVSPKTNTTKNVCEKINTEKINNSNLKHPNKKKRP